MFRVKVIAAGSIVAVAALLSVHADVIDPNYHPVERCVVIENGDEFPDIALVGAYTGPTTQNKVERYVIHPDSCLTKGYKLNSFYLFWVEKSYLESQGLENLALKDLLPAAAKRRSTGDGLSPMGLVACAIEPFGGVVPDTDPVVKEHLIFRLSAAPGEDAFNCLLAEKTTIDSSGYENRVVYTVAVMPERKSGSADFVTLPLQARLSRGYLLFSPEFNGKAAAELIDCRGRSIVRFSRECRKGHTYLIRSANHSAGIYWLRVKGNGATVNRPIRMFR